MLRSIVLYIAIIIMGTAVIAEKAGVGTWENSDYSMLDWVERQDGLSWYYNWRADQLWTEASEARGVEFVPMIHSADDVDINIHSQTRVKAMLGFNEPDGDRSHQANLSVETALQLWPQLESHGVRLGSPATTQSGTLGSNSWLGQFMQGVDERGLRVDFVAVHYYSDTGDVGAFRTWLRQVYQEYRRPIWVTEFALIDWDKPERFSFEDNARFVERAIPMLETLGYVERYAWFAALPYQWGNTTPEIHLVSDGLQATPVGNAYAREIGRRLVARAAGL